MKGLTYDDENNNNNNYFLRERDDVHFKGGRGGGGEKGRLQSRALQKEETTSSPAQTVPGRKPRHRWVATPGSSGPRPVA